MSADRQARIDAARRSQPIEELLRKQQKAFRPHIWTVEDMDLADREAAEMGAWFRDSKPAPKQKEE